MPKESKSMPKEILALDLQKRRCFKEVLSKKKYGSKWLKNLLYNFPSHCSLFTTIYSLKLSHPRESNPRPAIYEIPLVIS
jgi:hypothetical protein